MRSESIPTGARSVRKERAADKRPIPLITRLFAAAGFALTIGGIVLLISGQFAQERIREYVRERYRVDVDVPVTGIRPNIISGPLASKKPVPPLGFCWTADIDSSIVAGEVSLNPWTHEVVDWRVDRLFR